MDLTDLNWSDLKFFLAVARCGSLGKAASKLKVTHSTVFRRLNSLESAMDIKLFARLPEGYRLTDDGAEMLAYVERVSERIDELQRRLDNRSDSLRGVINLTAPHNLAYRYLPGYLAEFRHRYPELQVNLLVGNEALNLSRREADLAIRATPAPPEQLIGHKLLSLAWGAYAAPTYLAEHGSPAATDDLPGHAIISAHDELLRLPAFAWVERQIPAQRIAARCSDLIAMSALAVAGLGIALLPDDQAKPELRRLFDFAPGRHSDLWLLSHPDLRDNRGLRLLKDFIIEKFRADPVFREYGLAG
ncbi:MAG: LysR family transcriptional regulator [Pseudomonas sp.]